MNIPRELKESKNVQLTAAVCLGVFHISSAAKQAIAEEQQRSRSVPKYVSKSETAREREKEISETDDLPAPHDLPPSACHSQSLSHSLFFSPRAHALACSLCLTHTHTHQPHRRSGYSGWCYSRCGVVEVSML